MYYTRRSALAGFAALSLSSLPVFAQQGDIWTVAEVNAALEKGEVVLVDVRRPEEWAQTGVAQGAWPLDMTSGDFTQKLFKARELADGRPVALICRTANRTGFLMSQIRKAGLTGFVDTVGGMAGKGANKGWIESGLPTVDAQTALNGLPAELR